MKFVMLTYTHMDRVREWEQMPEQDQKELVGEHIAWFQKYTEHITGGSELAYPPVTAQLMRSEGQLSVVDGPFAETKELLGGFIEIEADSLEAATAMAAEWPNLDGPGNRVVVSAIAEQRDLS